MLDIRRALQYASEDPRATEKFGLGAVISLTPILNLAVVGYEVEVARRVAQGQPRPLPEWNELRRLWIQGAALGLAYFVYSLPVLLIVFGGMTVLFAGFVYSIQSDSARSGAEPAAVVFGIFLTLVVAAVVYGLTLGLLRPAILAGYVQHGTFQACFDFGAMWRFIRHDRGEYVLLWLAELVLGWVISLPFVLVVFVVGFIPFLGPVLLGLIAGGISFFLLLFSGHLVGQLLRARSSEST